MNKLRNERGVALITALMLTLIILAIVMVALYLLNQGVQVSAANRRYSNALEAAHGGGEVFTKTVLGQIFSGVPVATLTADLAGISLFIPYSSCLKAKMTTATAKWEASSKWDPALCGVRGSATKDPYSKDATKAPDATFKLRGTMLQPGFNVYTKIVDTVPGNSDISGVEQLDGASGVAYSSSGVSPEHFPAMLTIEVQGQRETNPKEVAKLSVLYAY
jgi:hypothetical protein